MSSSEDKFPQGTLYMLPLLGGKGEDLGHVVELAQGEHLGNLHPLAEGLQLS